MERNTLNVLPSDVEPFPCHSPSSGDEGAEVVAAVLEHEGDELLREEPLRQVRVAERVLEVFDQ